MLYKKLPIKITKIFIDLDDTLVDFVGEALILLGYKNKVTTKQDLKKFWSFIDTEEGQKELWLRVNKIGPQWWVNLPMLPWAKDLLSAAKKACKNVAILTSPGETITSETAALGKILWSIKEFGENRLILAKQKYMCASPGTILIDDWEKFTKPWEEAGGTAIKLKREWNKTGYTHDEIIDTLLKYSRLNPP